MLRVGLVLPRLQDFTVTLEAAKPGPASPRASSEAGTPLMCGSKPRESLPGTGWSRSPPPPRSVPSLIARSRLALARRGEASARPGAGGVRLLHKHPPTTLLPSRKAEPAWRPARLACRPPAAALPATPPAIPARWVATGHLPPAPPHPGAALNPVSKENLAPPALAPAARGV